MGLTREKTPLLGDAPAGLDPHWAQRYYVLALFSLLAHNQVCLWFTFSSDPGAMRRYYPGMTTAEIDLLLNWGCIVYVAVCPFAAYLLTRRNGLRTAIRVAAVLSCLACAVRYIPCFLPAADRADPRVRYLLHAGQMLNAAAGPISMAAPARLAAVWFPPRHRARATALGWMASNLGGASGFLFGPYLIDGDPARTTQLLYIQFFMSLLPLLLALAFLPRHPRDRPYHQLLQQHLEGHEQHTDRTDAGELQNADGLNAGGHPRSHFRQAWRLVKDAGALLRNPAVLLLVVAGGIEGGAGSGWSGVLTMTLAPPTFEPKFVAWLGFLNLLAGVAGNMLSGVVADLWFRRSLKAPIVVFFFWAAAAYAWFAFLLPTPWAREAALPTSKTLVLAASVLAGGLQGAIDPCLYELAAELSL